jgi:drug/metabolite transporter (DMT)-like permease
VSRRLQGALCLFAAAAIWGGMYVVSKAVLAYIPPLTLLALRLAIGGLVLLAVIRALGMSWPGRADRGEMALLGFVGFGVSLAAQFIGTHLSTAAHGAVLTSVTPAFILVFAAVWLGERLTARTAAAVAVATAGALLVIEQPGGFALEARTFWGDILLLAAGVSWALYTVLSRRAAHRHPPAVTTAAATLWGLLFLLPWLPLELRDWTWAPLPAAVWWGVLYLGVVSTALAFWLWNTGFTLMQAGTASLFFFAQPLVGAVLGWLLLGERLGSRFLAGSLILIAGGILAVRAERKT